MNDCAAFTRDLYELHEGEAPPEWIAAWQAHRTVCASCAALAHSYGLTVALARRLPEPGPPPDAMARLARALAAEQPPA